MWSASTSLEAFLFHPQMLGVDELRVRYAVDFIAGIELNYAGSDCFHDTRQIGAERERRWWADFRFAFTDERVPRTHTSRHNSH